jgi:hypothetical protein
MSVVVNILAAIGLIVIISYLSVYLYNHIKNRQVKATVSKIYPPGDYMQNSGVKCPDYWVNTGIDSNGNYICKNSFNIQSNNPKTGNYAGKCNADTMTFTPIGTGLPAPPSGTSYTWQYGNPTGYTSLTDKQKYDFLENSASQNSMSRCAWVNNCGPNSNVQGIWSGVNEICNSPPPTS